MPSPLPHPQPEFRQHRTIGGSDDAFRPGATIAQDSTIRTIIPIASAQAVRIRFKASVAGTLAASFIMPGTEPGEYSKFTAELDGTDPVSQNGIDNPTVAVSAGTEALLEIPDIKGEAYILLEFTEPDTAAGTVTYCNVCQL